jgi:hypothetical protein
MFCDGRSDADAQAEICGAHDSTVWDLAWHPLGHILASASNDCCTRFWTRNRPGDEMKDKYNANQLPEDKRIEALTELAEAGLSLPPFLLSFCASLTSELCRV